MNEIGLNDADDAQDFDGPSNMERCDCQYCFCLQDTEYGAKCSDCRAGAHQG